MDAAQNSSYWLASERSNTFSGSGVGGDRNRAKKEVNVGPSFIRWTDIWLHMNATVAPYLLDELMSDKFIISTL